MSSPMCYYYSNTHVAARERKLSQLRFFNFQFKWNTFKFRMSILRGEAEWTRGNFCSKHSNRHQQCPQGDGDYKVSQNTRFRTYIRS